MTRIEEFIVSSPARSEDVRQQALEAMGSHTVRGVLELTLHPDRDVPAAGPEADTPVSFRIQQTTQLGEHGGTLSGHRVMVAEGGEGVPSIEFMPSTVTVRLAEDPDLPATASMTVED